MTLSAADIMTKHVITARPDDSVLAVSKLLIEHDISAVPVCSAQGALLGMLSEGDFLHPFGNETLCKRSWWLSLLAEGSDLAPAFLKYVELDKSHAQDVMVTPVITALETTSVADIADLLAKNRIKRVPIMRGAAIIGIVSRADIVRAIVGMAQDELASI